MNKTCSSHTVTPTRYSTKNKGLGLCVCVHTLQVSIVQLGLHYNINTTVLILY